MHFFFDVSVSANTAAVLPHTERLTLSSGVITKVTIVIPSGHFGLAHLQLTYHSAQLYPLSRGEDYHGDNLRIEFEDYFPITVLPAELKAIAWNDDDTYAHSFLVGFAVLREQELPKPVPDESILAMQELIGYEGEV
jgi:hypothetical protein